MKRRPALLGAALLALLCACAPEAARAQAPITGSLGADAEGPVISRHIYGHFAEHLGRSIYGGFWEKNAAGAYAYREDVIAALRKLRIPNVRWPGGCFADTYHWKDGIGPRAQRPTIINTHWGGVVEDNSFGTHEFMELAAKLGAEPYIVGNVGSGSVQEMAQWVEYMTFGGESPMARLRAANGRAEPWRVRFWGVGNENWGCGGNMRPEYYADLYRNYATYLNNYGDNRLYKIAGGANSEDYNWTDVLMRQAGRMMDGLSLHYYTIVHNWDRKGSATDFNEQEWTRALERALHIEELITRHSTIMDRYDPQRRVGLIVDEWGIWHDVEPGTNPGFLYQQNTLRDALIAAVSLDIFNRHAERVRMANIAQTLNVLQAMILTEPGKMVLTPTYHVFEMYAPHHDAVSLPLTLRAGMFESGGVRIPHVTGSASRDSSGQVFLTLSNLDPREAHALRLGVHGRRYGSVSGRVLTAPAMQAHNTFAQPEVVRPQPFTGARLSGDALEVTLPPRSVVALALRP